MQAFTFAHIALKDINDSGRYSLHPFLGPQELSPELLTSVSLCGILTPPTVAVDAYGGYELICGRQRLKCCATILGSDGCLCRVLPHTAAIEDILACALEDQFYAGCLSIMEQAVFVALCHRLIADTSRREAFLSTLPPGRITKGGQFLLQVSQLDDRLKKAVHETILSERILGELHRLPKNDRLRFAALAEQLGLGGNQQRKLLSQLADICARKNTDLEDLLQEDDLRSILEDPQCPQSQKTDRFVRAVGRLSHPALSAAAESFGAEVRALQLPDWCDLAPTPSFEKDEVHFSARFATLNEFRDFWKAMKKASSGL